MQEATMSPLLVTILVLSLLLVKTVKLLVLLESSAQHSTGATMEPVSWQEMRCPKTGKIEKRKCAKPEGL